MHSVAKFLLCYPQYCIFLGYTTSESYLHEDITYLFALVDFILSVSLRIPSVYNKIIHQYKYAFRKFKWRTEGSKIRVAGVASGESPSSCVEEEHSSAPNTWLHEKICSHSIFFCILVTLPFLPLINVKQMKYSSVPNKLLNFSCVYSF